MNKVIMESVQISFDPEKEDFSFEREDYDGDICITIPFTQLKAAYKIAKKEMETKIK